MCVCRGNAVVSASDCSSDDCICGVVTSRSFFPFAWKLVAFDLPTMEATSTRDVTWCGGSSPFVIMFASNFKKFNSNSPFESQTRLIRDEQVTR